MLIWGVGMLGGGSRLVFSGWLTHSLKPYLRKERKLEESSSEANDYKMNGFHYWLRKSTISPYIQLL